jgi:hypothetical protein
MQMHRLRLHMASGREVETTIEVTDDLDEREVEELIHRTLTATERGSWQQLGDVHFHTAAVQAVEIL